MQNNSRINGSITFNIFWGFFKDLSHHRDIEIEVNLALDANGLQNGLQNELQKVYMKPIPVKSLAIH